MAVAAEALQQIQTFESVPDYLLVDAIPEIAAARERERQSAEDLLECRRIAADGKSQSSPLIPVDALSTAHKVLAAGRIYGQDSIWQQELQKGLVLDCQRLVAEWYRKKKPEYFKPLRHVFNKDTEEFFSHGLSIRQMTENALIPIRNNPEEEARRVNEKVEDATPQILRKLGRFCIGEEVIRTISECSDKAISDYAEDMSRGRKHRGYDGYVPEIEKVMIRDIRLDTHTSDRFEEQIGLPGIYINPLIIRTALAERGAAPVVDMDKTQLHGSQMLVSDDLMDFVAHLDSVASREWCTEIYMGEKVAPGTLKNYDAFRNEALLRQEGLNELAETVTTFVLDLARDNVNRSKALGMVEEFVKKMLLKEAKHDMSVAEQMFDSSTSQGLQEVARLESIGGYCGAGSCGLEGVDMNSAEGQELAKKLGASAGDTIVKDKERACKCGKKNIVYAYNKSKVIKFCQGCGARESKVSKAPAAAEK
jgi:hypothetical protein